MIPSAHPLIILFPTRSFISRMVGERKGTHESFVEWPPFKVKRDGEGGGSGQNTGLTPEPVLHWLLLMDIPHSCSALFISMGR